MSDELPNVMDAISYDAETDTYRATFENRTTKPSLAIVEAISKVKNKKSIELTPLNTIIDVEAMDQFLLTQPDEPAGDRKAEFVFEDYMVTVTSYGHLSLQPLTTADRAPKEEC